MNLLSILGTGTSGGTGNFWVTIVLYVAVIGFVMYFLMIKPQKKQQQKHQAVVDAIEVGDSILTTSGFYGVVIDVNEDMVIVEFGNNKNCRIPMQKAAIVEIEKADAE